MRYATWLVLLMCMCVASPALAQGRGSAVTRIATLDRDGDGSVSRDEWRDAFDWLDADHDGRLSRRELDGARSAAPVNESPAFRAGFERGMKDGLQAGREDKPRGWDLDGQREMETADAGWQPSVGDRAEYQAGYRTGFRRGYTEGFGPRR